MDFSSFELQPNTSPFKQDFTPHPHDSESAQPSDDAEFFHFMNSHYETPSTTASSSSFTMPQLSPEDNTSHLSGHPEFNMSPLQIASQPITNTLYNTPSHPSILEDEEEFFTPLVSPAIAPTYNTSYASLNNSFSPLTSPALHPTSYTLSDQTTLQQKLAFIERQQQQLRTMHHQLHSTKASPVLASTKKTLQPKIASNSPHISPRPFTTDTTDIIAPATPSLLMKLGSGLNSSHPATSASTPVPNTTATTNNSSPSVVDHMPTLPAAILPPEINKIKKKEPKRRRISSHCSPGLSPSLDSPLVRPIQSPRALKPFISPSLKPDGKRLSMIEEETARALLTSKSNYENLKEGKAKSLGIDFSTTIQSGIENRRSAHKAAEQKRRDTLKQSFDSLRAEIMDALISEENDSEDRQTKEKDVKQMSKVVLLQHSYEYILRLKNENKRKEEKQNKMRTELMALRRQLGLPEVTEEEKEAEERERKEELDRREASRKRLQKMADHQENNDLFDMKNKLDS
ncbi:hypothetical protein A0J61_07749 [Choanephora cucurbitarum]|uniref:BHLH domain-containing protein n=1 Tax=Choanephora cucurbitarum TaxID=101091 RepID=A0A1C7N5B1_9FUNG|nr:hypothetical protein A0J61_07749 [Choanephora cucurbitarum]